MAKILIVEDDRLAIKLFREAFKREGYDVKTCNSSGGVVDIAANFKPDFVLLDLYMPDHGGLDACRQLRADPRTYDLPVVFITGSRESLDVMEALHIGCIDYVQKPIKPSDLVSLITRHSLAIKIDQAFQPMRAEMRRFLNKYSHA